MKLADFEIVAALNEGKKVRRLGWRDEKFLFEENRFYEVEKQKDRINGIGSFPMYIPYHWYDRTIREKKLNLSLSFEDVIATDWSAHKELPVYAYESKSGDIIFKTKPIDKLKPRPELNKFIKEEYK